ncbi:MAG: phosphate butyryltransferase [Candidatus Latescibacteria bacterium]|nr:phosphate butyryltransferase [Candidatus Latescibacterota bacterium]
MFKKFAEMIEMTKARGPRRCVVACAEDEPTIEALYDAKKEGIATGILFGEKIGILSIMKKLDVPANEFEIVDCATEKEAIDSAVKEVGANGDFLMKGQVTTSNFLRGVLDEKLGLRGERLLSHVALLEPALYHKILFVSDGGINIDLDLKKKIDIVKNVVSLVASLGLKSPKIALLSAIERVTLGMEETLDWAVITRMGDEGAFGDVMIEGPLALDVTFSPYAAKVKNVKTKISGDVDILMVPSIATGNIMCKGLQYLGNTKICGIIVGAKKPVVMLSRSDTKDTKLYSIALGNLVS